MNTRATPSQASLPSRTISAAFLCAFGAVSLLSACGVETVTGRKANLQVEAYEPGNYASVEMDGDVLVVDLGLVPVYSTRRARFVLSNSGSQVAADINGVSYTEETYGAVWHAPAIQGANGTTTVQINPEGQGTSARLLDIAYEPEDIGAAQATVEIRSSNSENRLITLRVIAEGVYQGAPDIEVRYGSLESTAPSGPLSDGCDGEGLMNNGVDDNGDGVVDGCSMPQTFDLGGAGLGSEITGKLYLVNNATCDLYPGSGTCETCVLTVDADSSRANIGIGFKPGTNDDGYFSMEGSTSLPVDLPQQEMGCSVPNFVRPVVKFNAPAFEGVFETVLVVETNDPDEPMIEIPIKATAVNAPIAVAGLREFDPTDITAPYSIDGAGNLLTEPYGRAYLDGRAKGTVTSSHDPSDPSDAGLITGYFWEVLEVPAGTNRDDLDFNGQGTGLFDFLMPLAGEYTVKLTVTNFAGLQSLETVQSIVTFDAVPREAVHVQLTWDSPDNDQDLHMTLASVNDSVCHNPYDVHWRNRQPVWFDTSSAGVGANPRLDVDDTSGLGPENINIDVPEPGTYRIYVHYWGDFTAGGVSPTRETIRIWINGVQQAEFARTLSLEKSIWRVADITWRADGTGFVTAIPPDVAGEVGAVNQMDSCTDSGWVFP